jgi:hypothetical protein
MTDLKALVRKFREDNTACQQSTNAIEERIAQLSTLHNLKTTGVLPNKSNFGGKIRDKFSINEGIEVKMGDNIMNNDSFVV